MNRCTVALWGGMIGVTFAFGAEPLPPPVLYQPIVIIPSAPLAPTGEWVAPGFPSLSPPPSPPPLSPPQETASAEKPVDKKRDREKSVLKEPRDRMSELEGSSRTTVTFLNPVARRSLNREIPYLHRLEKKTALYTEPVNGNGTGVFSDGKTSFLLDLRNMAGETNGRTTFGAATRGVGAYFYFGIRHSYTLSSIGETDRAKTVTGAGQNYGGGVSFEFQKFDLGLELSQQVVRDELNNDRQTQSHRESHATLLFSTAGRGESAWEAGIDLSRLPLSTTASEKRVDPESYFGLNPFVSWGKRVAATPRSQLLLGMAGEIDWKSYQKIDADQDLREELTGAVTPSITAEYVLGKRWLLSAGISHRVQSDFGMIRANRTEGIPEDDEKELSTEAVSHLTSAGVALLLKTDRLTIEAGIGQSVLEDGTAALVNGTGLLIDLALLFEF